ncbi:MAG TPA: ABC transporter permease, partial [Blastocatellia bacterium]|nr:ABC transporter permease [Blastocatellia bacterium]
RNLFDVMGISLAQGQVWPEEYDRERNFGVVLSHELWQRRFGGDPGIIGQKIALDAAPFYTVFGVLPPGIDFPAGAQMFRSICINRVYPNYEARDARNVYALARLKSGVSYRQAQAELDAFSRRLAETYPNFNSGLGFRLTPLTEFYVGDVRPYLLLLLGAAGFVLLIACGNVVNLLLARALAREKEVAIRTALGAGRGRLIRQLLTESVLLALLSGAAGLALAFWWVELLAAMIRIELPPWMTIRMDLRVLIFVLLISMLTGVLAGLAPALQASRPNLNELLKEGARGSSGGARYRLRRALAAAEIALALVLLVGAGLMMRSFLRLRQTDLGFNADSLLTFRVALPWRKYSGDDGREKQAAFYQQAMERLTALPGVTAVAANSNLPLSGETEAGKLTVTVEGQSVEEQLGNPYVNDLRVSPNYFQVMGILLLKGRFFSESETTKTPLAAIVSQRLAERLWPRQELIDKRLKIGPPHSQGRWMTVVGVVGNVKHEQISGDAGLDLYVSYLQVPDGNMYLLMRTKVPPLTLADAATKVIWSVDEEQSTFDIRTMEDRIADTIWQRRVSGTLFTIFAALAVILAAVGIYSVMSYSVSQRTREIGIRMALGAQTADALKMVLGEVLQLTLIGGGIGLAGAFILARFVSSLLYGVSANDPLTFVSVLLLLAAVALAAGFIPARRAARVDPMVALRYE